MFEEMVRVGVSRVGCGDKREEINWLTSSLLKSWIMETFYDLIL